MAISIDTLKRLSRDQRNFFLTFGLLGLGILIGISLVYLEISDILREQAEQRTGRHLRAGDPGNAAQSLAARSRARFHPARRHAGHQDESGLCDAPGT